MPAYQNPTFFFVLSKWELNELDNLYKVLEQRHGLTFQKKDVHASSLYHPRRMTLEALKPFYRPLLVYAIFMVFKYFGKLALYAYGFRRYVTANGLVSWYRPAKIESEKSFLPMLFFHGIAPGGVTGYLPMILHGLATEKERPVLLFENKSISLVLDFNFLDEQQTVDGVIETLERFGHTNRPLSLVGHSFGSCPIAWLITSKQLRNIKQIVLLDPVAISLSEPDVMENFLYSEENPMIRMLASSELSIQYYLRRIFAWYNSELYISDVDCPILVCLSEQDNIVPSRKVKQEMERHDAPAPENKLLYWKGAGHGACITNPKKWKQIKGLMLEQELMIFQGRS
jgi:pimeloyl-ACP methyl ester carboxylesterase